MKFFFFATTFFLVSPWASAAPEAYQCRLLIAADDLAEGGDWTFPGDTSEEGHGGKISVFTAPPYEVQVLGNAQWMGISWFRKGEKIAEGVFVLGSDDRAAHRVAILYDPADSDRQVSLGCERE